MFYFIPVLLVESRLRTWSHIVKISSIFVYIFFLFPGRVYKKETIRNNKYIERNMTITKQSLPEVINCKMK